MDMFLKQDELAVEQYASRKAMGEAAAKEVAAKIAGLPTGERVGQYHFCRRTVAE